MNGSFNLLASALARVVLPVPETPYRSVNVSTPGTLERSRELTITTIITHRGCSLKFLSAGELRTSWLDGFSDGIMKTVWRALRVSHSGVTILHT